jgi:predicted enzyme related to lactoylglutathione lyase
MPLSCKTAFVALAELNQGQLVDFYRQLLNLEPVLHSPGRYAEFHLPGLRLGIFLPRPDHREEFISSTNSGISLCLEVEGLDRAIAHLTQLGYPPPGPIIHASHGREVYAYDPAGNRLILHEATA